MVYPKISVIVPVRNEERHIEECLKQLMIQSYPKDKIEILVVDGMSNDRTREIVRNFINNNNFLNIKLLDNPKRRIEPALNIGIRSAKGDVIMRIDARTSIPGDYIEKCVQTLVDTGADNVGGVQKPIVRKTGDEKRELFQQSIGIAMSHFFGIGNAQFRLGKKSGFVDTVYLGCFKREIFDKVGLFDEYSYSISEDSDMNYRIRKSGGRIYLNKNIIAYYYPRDRLTELAQLYFSYGLRRAGNFLKYKKFTSFRQFVPPTFLFSLILLPILGIFSKFFLFLWFLVAGSYIVTNFLISLFLSFKYSDFNIEHGTLNSEFFISNPKLSTPNIQHRPSNKEHSKLSLFWRLFLVFPTMHFSWAFGFWWRLFRRPKPGGYLCC